MAASKTQRRQSPRAGATAAGPEGYGQLPAAAARDYAALSFKELLAACPLEGIELTRERDLPRDVDL